MDYEPVPARLTLQYEDWFFICVSIVEKNVIMNFQIGELQRQVFKVRRNGELLLGFSICPTRQHYKHDLRYASFLVLLLPEQ